MSVPAHPHTMVPIGWTLRQDIAPACGHTTADEFTGPKNEKRFVEDVVRCPFFMEHPNPPRVILACSKGGCIKVEVVSPGKRDRAVPDGLTNEQFVRLKAGEYWLDIVGA